MRNDSLESSSAMIVEDEYNKSSIVQDELMSNINGSQTEKLINSQLTTSDKNGSIV